MRTLTMVSEVPKEQYNPILQWRLNEKLEGAYCVRYGTGDISWKKIASDAAEMLIAVGCVVLAPFLAGPDYTGRLDRIDSKKGYVPGNVQWVYKPVNMMKWKLSQKEFIHICHLVTEYNAEIQ